MIEESLRLYPPVYALGRDVRADDEIGGFFIPARSMVVLSPYVTHHHPEVWPDPETFDPDRFTPDRCARRPGSPGIRSWGGRTSASARSSP